MAIQKIAVLGGGMGALSAIYAITSQESWADRYAITVYQLGWRLGGKGATGRDRQRADRILEHGYHMLFGFYENTFAMLRHCFAELGRDERLPISAVLASTSAEEQAHPGRYAFYRQNTAVLLQRMADGSWHDFVFDFPENTDLPGDPGELPHPLAYIEMATELLARIIGGIAIDELDTAVAPLTSWWERIEAKAPHLLPGLDPSRLDRRNHRGLLDAARLLVHQIVDAHPDGTIADAVGRIELAALTDLLRDYLRLVWLLVKGRVHSDWRAFKLWITSDFICTNIIGLIDDDAISKGLDSLDQMEYWQWFRSHGTVPEGVDVTCGSCLMQSAYDASFAYANGDTTAPATDQKPLLGRPTMGAGTMLRGAMRFALTYKGAMAWKFQTGCAEALAAPLYEVLRRRGVKFEFFSKVQHLGLRNGRAIDRIDIQRQVRLRDPERGYDPLIEVNQVQCWPSEPLWDQIENGDTIRGYDLESDWTTWSGVEQRTLSRGADFDQVILAISLGALPGMCSELIAASPAWREMVDALPSVRTQAMQLWTNRDSSALGWTGPSAPIGTGVEPMDTWADMSQLTARETWSDAATPKGISYFCCAMPDDPAAPRQPDATYPATQLELVRETAIEFLDTQSTQFWPAAQTADGFDWQTLVANDGVTGRARLDEQYLRASIDASDRYVLSPPGSARLRLRPGDSGFENLTLAGDWTANTINAGCMEATVMSGLAASRAITGHPEKIPGEADFGQAGPRRAAPLAEIG